MNVMINASKLIFLLLVSTIAFLGCDPESEEVNGGGVLNNSLQPLAWLEGTWNDQSTFGFKDPPQHIMETWKAYPDSLSGYGFRTQGGDTVITELITIMVVNDKLTYVARPDGQALVSFTLTSSGDDYWVFENKANDFPQKLVYTKFPNDSLGVTLEGVHNTMSHSLTFKYNREK